MNIMLAFVCAMSVDGPLLIVYHLRQFPMKSVSDEIGMNMLVHVCVYKLHHL